MQRELAKRLLRSIIPETAWDEEELQRLFAELDAMADYKYNRYEMYQPGRLFLENLYLWLLKLEADERKPALEFVRNKLIFISREEFQQLAHVLYQDGIYQRQLDIAARQLGVARHRIRAISSSTVFRRLQRASLYVAMSDGARIDYFRRQNLDINNEQVLATYQPSTDKVKDVTKELMKVQGTSARFQCLFLLDDFSGSGRTLLREVVIEPLNEPLEQLVIPPELGAHVRYDEEKHLLEFAYSGPSMQEEFSIRSLSSANAYQLAVESALRKMKTRDTQLKGSLKRLLDESGLRDALAPNVCVCFCPLLITEYATSRLLELVRRLEPPMNTLEVLPGALLSNALRIGPLDGPMSAICEKHYSTGLQDKHTGCVKFGYDQCGLPLVLHHNTPNNSIYVLWSRRWEHPLFVRYERHGREGH